MDEIKKYYLVQEIFNHCSLSLTSFTNVSYLLKDFGQHQSLGIWYDLQAGLTHSGIVSKFIFSLNAKAVKRTSFLKQLYEITNDSTLLNREARNYFEHIDEKFDFWLNNEFGGFLDAVFEDRRAFEYIRKDNFFTRRILLMDEMIFIYQIEEEKKELHLLPLISEVERIYQVSEYYLNNNKPENLFFITPNNG